MCSQVRAALAAWKEAKENPGKGGAGAADLTAVMASAQVARGVPQAVDGDAAQVRFSCVDAKHVQC